VRRLITHVGEWFDRRLQLAAPIREVSEHPVPRNTASWWYVFGSATLVVFLLTTERAFDDFAKSGADDAANRRMLGLDV
jgi:hypothetical protein